MRKVRSSVPAEARAPRHRLTLRRDFKGAVISDQKTYRCTVCPFEHFAGRRPSRPLGRPSRSPNFERSPRSGLAVTV
eukprot:9326339-Pyramimonas_sp.AAC.1